VFIGIMEFGNQVILSENIMLSFIESYTSLKKVCFDEFGSNDTLSYCLQENNFTALNTEHNPQLITIYKKYQHVRRRLQYVMLTNC
jgi:hypothetical protein